MPSLTPAELLTSLRWRYATKSFDSEKRISESLWRALEESLVLTPSSFGLQPWKFLVITDPKVKQELLPHSWNQSQVTDCSHYLVMAAPTTVGKEDVENFLQLTAATRETSIESLSGYRDVLLGFMGNLDEQGRITWAAKQIYLALGQILASAAALEVDACPMEGFLPAEYDRILQLPEKNLTSIVACAFGYRSADDKYALAPKVRYSAEQVIEHI